MGYACHLPSGRSVRGDKMSEKNWIVKAFHTGGPYQKDADKLKASAKKFDIPIDIELIKSRGCWNANTHYKPRSIIEAMLNHPHINYIIHMDVDTWFMQYPTLFDELDCDIGVYYWNNLKTWCSGTVIARNCSATVKFLEAWEAALRTNPRQHGDQVAMGRLLEGPASLVTSLKLNMVKIPAGYLQGLAPNVREGEGVIAHDGARKRYIGTDIYSDPK